MCQKRSVINASIHTDHLSADSNSSLTQEEQWVIGCKNGDSRYQRMVYEKYAPKMLSVCRRYTNNLEDARDLMHDGFIKVFLKINSFEFRSKLETWITRIMINNAINAIKKQVMVELEEHHIGGEWQDPDKEAHYKEQDSVFDKVLAIIQTLPVGYRTILNLYAVEKYSHKEIADMLGISEGTSKSQLNRARAALKSVMGKEGIVYEG